MVLVCGRFEGIDERVIEARGLEELSLGDFVLSGGEPAAVALMCRSIGPSIFSARSVLSITSRPASPCFEAKSIKTPLRQKFEMAERRRWAR